MVAQARDANAPINLDTGVSSVDGKGGSGGGSNNGRVSGTFSVPG